MKMVDREFIRDLDSSKSVVLVIDMQNDFCSVGGYYDRHSKLKPCQRHKLREPTPPREFEPRDHVKGILGPIVGIMETALKNSVNVILIQSDYGPLTGPTKCDLFSDHPCRFPCRQGTWGQQLICPIQRLQEKHHFCILSKNHHSAFADSGLKEYLSKEGIESLVVVGVETDYCVRATAEDAMAQKFKVIIPQDCTATASGTESKQKTLSKLSESELVVLTDSGCRMNRYKEEVDKKFHLTELLEHLSNELAALDTIADAFENEGRLRCWFHEVQEASPEKWRFLEQLMTDSNVAEAILSMKELLGIYKEFKCVHKQLRSYILLHDLAKPLDSGLHDHLIAYIMSTLGEDESYSLWKSFGVECPKLRNLFNVALRHHHILGVMIIGELSYLIYDQLFRDPDFERLDQTDKEKLLNLLILHAAVDSSAIREGYLSRKKLDRYFGVVAKVKEAMNILKKTSDDHMQTRIIWLLSSYDKRIDSYGEEPYRKALIGSSKWKQLSGKTHFVNGMTKIRRIVYGAEFLFKLAHRGDSDECEDDEEKRELGKNFLVGLEVMLDALEVMAEKAVEREEVDVIEFHFDFKNDREILAKAVREFNRNSFADNITFEAGTKILKIDLKKIGPSIHGGR